MKAIAFDFTAMVHRAFHTGTPNPGGLANVWAMAILLEQEPDFCVLAVDKPGRTFRHELFPSYKESRGKKPGREEEQAKIREHQTKALDELATMYGLRTVGIAGYEADDVIATFARLAVERGCDEVRIVANDKDLLQLVGGPVFMHHFPGVEQSHPLDVVAKLGVYPEQVVDYLAMVGDSVDDIPGVKGVGPKGAVDLIQEFGSIEAVLTAAPEHVGKAGQRVQAAGPEHLALMRTLVRLRNTAPLDFDDLRVNLARLREGLGWDGASDDEGLE